MVSTNTLCKNILNVKNAVFEDCNLYSDEDGVKHILIKARPNKWHKNDCPFCHKACPVYDNHSSKPSTWRDLDWGGMLVVLTTRLTASTALNMKYMSLKFHGFIQAVGLQRTSVPPLIS